MASTQPSLGARIRAARKERRWSQQRLAEKANVGGAHEQGRIKMIQRIEAGKVTNRDALMRVAEALGLEARADELPNHAELTESVPRRRTRSVAVVDGLACISALLALALEAWRFVTIELDHDIADDAEVDEAMMAVAAVVDRFQRIGASFEPADAFSQAKRPQLSLAKRYRFGVRVRKAAAVLRRHGLQLMLVDVWKEHPAAASEALLTRIFRVTRAAPEGDNVTATLASTSTRTTTSESNPAAS